MFSKSFECIVVVPEHDIFRIDGWFAFLFARFLYDTRTYARRNETVEKKKRGPDEMSPTHSVENGFRRGKPCTRNS